MDTEGIDIAIREASEKDRQFVTDLMDCALSPWYGGDHRTHAERIFSTHVSGGQDLIGHFSFEQKIFIVTVGGAPAGMINLVGKRQGTYKISPIIVAREYQHKHGLGTMLLEFAEEYAKQHSARQMYCTVAEQNHNALQFFLRRGYVVVGRSDSHYKSGITEVMMQKLFVGPEFEEKFDRPHISVLPCDESHKAHVRRLLLDRLPQHFKGVDSDWVDALFRGYKRRDSGDVNLKYKLIYVAVDRSNTVLGVAGATPKKGTPIKVMPLIATTLPAFVALVTDIPNLLRPYGRKLYIHITPSVEETIALQQRGWRLDAAMPGAYHEDCVTQQWGLDIEGGGFMRLMRTKHRFLDLIRAGKKTVEVRVAYDSLKTIQPGERIRFTSRTRTQVVRVRDIRRYPSFEAMLDSEDPSRVVPGSSKLEVLGLLREIYPPEREELGVVALDIEADRSVPSHDLSAKP